MAYRLDRRTVSIDEARGMLAVHGEPVTRVERLALDAAAGCVVARDVYAASDIPPFARAVMDGYAVKAIDTDGASRDTPVHLTLVESIFTGSVPTRAIELGECAAIATGAPLPKGADSVVMVEQSSADGSHVLIFEPSRPGQHVGRAGGDLVAGELALAEGTVLTPARIGVAAALGLADLEVFTRPRVAILSTGDEIVAPGERLAPGQIFDANTSALAAAVAAHGGEPVVQPRTRDDRAALTDAFNNAVREDLVLFCGGSSVGERDFSLEILSALGTVYFAGLQLKPGKPTIFATVDGVPVFGLPGNPVSCLTNMYLFVAPMLRRIARLPPPIERIVVARLADEVSSPRGRHQVYPVRLEGDNAVPVFKSSGEITSLARADGFFEIPADVERVEAGARIEVVLF
jgi:molybdenum cofactor synthesis domain-containing protein